MNEKQIEALRGLKRALTTAHECGVLDFVQQGCEAAGSINDVIDAVGSTLEDEPTDA
jgi:hypothetical protein